MDIDRLYITGMTGVDCARKVTEALEKVCGVAAVDVSVFPGHTTIHYDERQTNAESLRLAIENVGYGVRTAPDNGMNTPSKYTFI